MHVNLNSVHFILYLLRRFLSFLLNNHIIQQVYAFQTRFSSIGEIEMHIRIICIKYGIDISNDNSQQFCIDIIIRRFRCTVAHIQSFRCFQMLTCEYYTNALHIQMKVRIGCRK